MGPPAEELGHEAAGRRPGLLRPADQPGRGPCGVGSMRLGHVRGRGGRLAIVPAEMRGDPPPLRVDFDGRRRKPHLHQVMDELVRHAVEVTVDLDVVVDADPARFPLGQDVATGRQRPERRPVELVVARPAADAELLQGAVVQVAEPGPDGRIQRGETEESLVAEPREDPSLRHEHRGLDDGFVFRLARAGRHDHGLVVRRQFFIGTIDPGLVPTRSGNGTLQLVRYPQGGRAPEVLDHSRMRAHPVRELLRRRRFGVGVAAGAEHGHKQLDRPDLAGTPVDDRRSLTGEVDEGLLAGAMHLAHRRAEPAGPLPVQHAELAVAVPLRIDLRILFPEQLQGHPRPGELAMDLRKCRRRTVPDRGRPREQARLERRIVEFVRKRPAPPVRRRAPHVEGDCPNIDRAGVRHLTVGQAPLVLES